MSDMMQQMRKFLEMHVKAMKRMPVAQYYQLMLDKGTAWSERVNTYQIEDDGKFGCKGWQLYGDVHSQSCWYNAAKFAKARRRQHVKYFEGFAMRQFFPTLHAWNVLPDGRLVDFTYDRSDRALSEVGEVPVTYYLGVEVPIGDVVTAYPKNNGYGPCAQRYHLKLDVPFLTD